jgi:hypothetical protein
MRRVDRFLGVSAGERVQPGAKLQQARYYNVFMVNTPNIQFGYYPSYCLGC